MSNELVNVRYIVNDVDDAVAFYTNHFGFEVRSSAAPAFADVVRGNLRLLLSGPKLGRAAHARRQHPRNREAGTESTSSSKTSPPRSSACVPPVCRSATTS